jgi:hypothetical protein
MKKQRIGSAVHITSLPEKSAEKVLRIRQEIISGKYDMGKLTSDKNIESLLPSVEKR